MLDNSTHYLTLFSHYLFYLFLASLISLSLHSLITNQQATEGKINLEQTGSLVLKQAEKSY